MFYLTTDNFIKIQMINKFNSLNQIHVNVTTIHSIKFRLTERRLIFHEQLENTDAVSSFCPINSTPFLLLLTFLTR